MRGPSRTGNIGGMKRITFETEPSRYVHWKLAFEGPVAHLRMDVQEDKGLDPSHPLKLNSYDLGVDIELADAVQRIRFEHPEVNALVVESAKDRIFCSGANIYMLGASTHAFKVNFCKYTNETRLYLEDLAEGSGVPSLAAINGTCAGGGYELALACSRIVLVDDGNAAVSLPETPLLAVLPGTGGLTRVVDKRKVRRDRADVFSTLAEGIRGKRAAEWNLVDAVYPRSRFESALNDEIATLVEASGRRKGDPVTLAHLGGSYEDASITHRYVRATIDEGDRTAKVTVLGPDHAAPRDAGTLRAAGADAWSFRVFRELDDVLLHLRFNHPTVGLIELRTEGSPEAVREHDRALVELAASDAFAHEVLLHMKRVLKRLDVTARSTFALIEPGSCFAGSLFELALAADRSYMLDDPDRPVHVGLSVLNFGGLPMGSGWTRLQTRFYGEPERLESARDLEDLLDPEAAEEAGLITFIPDDIDWEDEVRIAIEERVSLSPDALTGMEANLRSPGPETLETKIFGRLSAWQNWIFTRPNSTGEKGALTLYGKPGRPEFDWHRT